MRAPTIIRNYFQKGVMTSYDPGVIPYDALYRARNVRSDDSGILRIRRGVTKLGDSLGIGRTQGLKGAFGKILSVWNRNVYLTGVDGVRTQIGTDVIGGTKDDDVEVISWARGGAEIAYLFAGNGIYESDGATVSLSEPYVPASGEDGNLLLTYNADGTPGTTMDMESGPAKCRYATLRASLSQRLALYGDPDSPNTIYLSAPLDATYYPSAQVIQLPDDGSKIVGITNWYNALVVFRDRDIWAFFGTDLTDPSAALVLQDASTGCVSRRSIADVPGVGIVFLGPDNIYVLKGVTGVENQAKAIQLGDDIRSSLKEAMGDPENVSAIYYDQEYRLSIPNPAQEEVIFRLNLQSGMNWFIDTAPRIQQYLVFQKQLYGSKLDEGQLYLFDDSLTDDGKIIPFFVAFRREDLQPGPSRIKKIYIYGMSRGRKSSQEMNFFYSAFNGQPFNGDTSSLLTIEYGTEQSLDIDVVVNGQEMSLKEVQATIGKSNFLELQKTEPVKIYEVNFRPYLKGNFLQLRIHATKGEEDIAIVGYGIEHSTRGRIHASTKNVRSGREY